MSPKYWGESCDDNIKKIKIEDAVGTLLAHDITEIRPGEFKGAAFNAGHVVTEDDLCHLRRLGKKHLFVLNLNSDQIHENIAVMKLAEALCGPGVSFEPSPREGKINFKSIFFGLYKVKPEILFKLNMIPEIMCTSVHTNSTVKFGSVLAAIKIMPLLINSILLDHSINLITSNSPVLEVKSFCSLKVRLIITGNEIYEGLIEDKFEKIIREKLKSYEVDLLETVILPDDVTQIAFKARTFLNSDTNLLITTGGMSIDPDDVTRHAIRESGADAIYYGAAVTPGAMFQLAYFGDSTVISIPACALYHKITIFDLILPRLLAGEKPNAEDLARLAHGGLCMNCNKCTYPSCPFGKS